MGKKPKREWEKSMNICLIKVRYEMENIVNDIRVDLTLRNSRIVTGIFIEWLPRRNFNSFSQTLKTFPLT